MQLNQKQLVIHFSLIGDKKKIGLYVSLDTNTIIKKVSSMTTSKIFVVKGEKG